MHKYIITAITCLLFIGCIKDTPHGHGNIIRTGDKLPSFTVTMDDGSIKDSGSLSKGQSLIVFFNSGCEDCRNVMPVVNAYYTRHQNDVTVIAISHWEDKTSTDSYWKEKGFSIPKSSQNDDNVYSLFSEVGIPLLIASENGIVKAVFNSYTDGKNPTDIELEKIFVEQI